GVRAGAADRARGRGGKEFQNNIVFYCPWGGKNRGERGLWRLFSLLRLLLFGSRPPLFCLRGSSSQAGIGCAALLQSERRPARVFFRWILRWRGRPSLLRVSWLRQNGRSQSHAPRGRGRRRRRAGLLRRLRRGELCFLRLPRR